jgi:hypothetical protein
VADRFPAFEDERGTLLPIEFDEVPFPVRRVFVVNGTNGGHPRGDHVVPCDQLAVLLSGSARFRATAASGDRTAVLCERGESFRLFPGEHVVYDLDGTAASILVLASEPYAGEGAR